MVETKIPIFISLGPACNVKWAIDTFIGSKETMFFDWLMTDLKSVSQILGCNDINEIISKETVVQNHKNLTHSGHARILINSVDYCESIHDIPEIYNNNHIEEFIIKYKRRHKRILDLINSNKFNIFFIHYSSVETEDKNNFVECIKKINKHCVFTLVELIETNEKNIQLSNNNNILTLSLVNYQLRDKNQLDWRTSFWDWRKIFLTILENKKIS